MISKYHFSDKEIENEELLIRAASKNAENFTPLYRKYHEQIFRFVYQRVDSKETAQEITSDIFYKALLNIDKYKFKGLPFASWLYRIAHNELCNYFRKNKYTRAINIEGSFIENIKEERNEFNDEEYLAILKDTIIQLQENEINLIEMRFFQQFSFKEISQILAITDNNAKVKTYRVLDKLKKMILEKMPVQ